MKKSQKMKEIQMRKKTQELRGSQGTRGSARKRESQMTRLNKKSRANLKVRKNHTVRASQNPVLESQLWAVEKCPAEDYVPHMQSKKTGEWMILPKAIRRTYKKGTWVVRR